MKNGIKMFSLNLGGGQERGSENAAFIAACKSNHSVDLLCPRKKCFSYSEIDVR